MAQFRGTLRGCRGDASRLGSKASGLTVEAQSWDGKVVTRLWYDETTGRDMCDVSLDYHHGHGVRALLYRGPVGDPSAAGTDHFGVIPFVVGA